MVCFVWIRRIRLTLILIYACVTQLMYFQELMVFFVVWKWWWYSYSQHAILSLKKSREWRIFSWNLNWSSLELHSDRTMAGNGYFNYYELWIPKWNFELFIHAWYTIISFTSINPKKLKFFERYKKSTAEG